MYTRDFGGIKSDGQLHNMRQELYERAHMQSSEVESEKPTPPPSVGLFDKISGLFRTLEIDDLILIAIGILLLIDGDSSNDMLVIFVLILLLF